MDETEKSELEALREFRDQLFTAGEWLTRPPASDDFHRFSIYQLPDNRHHMQTGCRGDQTAVHPKGAWAAIWGEFQARF